MLNELSREMSFKSGFIKNKNFDETINIYLL